MTLLNASLLLGMISVAVPVALHLTARRPPRRVSFPAIRFLTPRVAAQTARRRLTRYWLLAARVAAVALIVLSLTRPQIASAAVGQLLGWAAAGLLGLLMLVLASWARSRPERSLIPKNASRPLGIAGAVALVAGLIGAIVGTAGQGVAVDTGGPVALAILLDTSPTSDAIDSDQSQSRIDRIRDQAVELVKRLPAGSRVAVAHRGVAEAAFALDPTAALTRIRQASISHTPVPIDRWLGAAARSVRRSDLEFRHVVVITDRSAATWSPDTTPDETGRDSSLAEEAERDIAFHVVDVSSGGDVVNRSLGIPRVVEASLAAGSAASINVSLRQSGPTPPRRQTVELAMYAADPSLPTFRDETLVLPDLRVVDRVQTDSDGELTLTLPPLGVGVHQAVVSLTGKDAFSADDRRALTVVVPPASRLTIVGGISQEREILAAAINAPAPVDADTAAYRIQRISWEDWLASDDEPTATVAIDPPTGDSAIEQRLEQDAAAGTGLLTTLGPSATASPDGSRWCPSRQRVWRVSGPGSFLTDLRGDGALLRDVASLRPVPPWGDYRVQKYWRLSLIAGDAEWRSVADWSGEGHPAIATRSDSGRRPVIVVSTPLPALGPDTDRWNDLFSSDAWPAFILIRSLAASICGRGGLDAMYSPGQVASASIVEPLPRDANEVVGSLYSPGTTVAVPLRRPNSNTAIAAGVIRNPGTHFVRGPGLQSGFSVNQSPRYSNIGPVDAAVVPARIAASQGWSESGAAEVAVVQTAGELRLDAGASTTAVPIRDPLLLLAAAAFLADVWLSRHAAAASSKIGGQVRSRTIPAAAA